jgi:hypothetical protein
LSFYLSPQLSFVVENKSAEYVNNYRIILLTSALKNEKSDRQNNQFAKCEVIVVVGFDE